MSGYLNYHIRYASNKDLLPNEEGLIKKTEADITLTNGLGIEGRVFIEENGAKILIPAPLHPAIFSAVKKPKDGSRHDFFVDGEDGIANGAFFGVADSEWLQKYTLNLQKALSKDTNREHAFTELSNLENDDINKHGRIGEAIYILMDLLKAKQSGSKYRSTNIEEYKKFIADINDFLNGKTDELENPIFTSLDQEIKRDFLKFVRRSSSAIGHYAEEQFPEMIKSNSAISYYNLSRDKIDNASIPAAYFADFNHQIQTLEEEAGLKKTPTQINKEEQQKAEKKKKEENPIPSSSEEIGGLMFSFFSLALSVPLLLAAVIAFAATGAALAGYLLIAASAFFVISVATSIAISDKVENAVESQTSPELREHEKSIQKEKTKWEEKTVKNDISPTGIKEHKSSGPNLFH